MVPLEAGMLVRGSDLKATLIFSLSSFSASVPAAPSTPFLASSSPSTIFPIPTSSSPKFLTQISASPSDASETDSKAENILFTYVQLSACEIVEVVETEEGPELMMAAETSDRLAVGRQ